MVYGIIYYPKKIALLLNCRTTWSYFNLVKSDENVKPKKKIFRNGLLATPRRKIDIKVLFTIFYEYFILISL